MTPQRLLYLRNIFISHLERYDSLMTARIRSTLAVLLLLAGIAFGCDFKIESASAERFYRSEGWALPSLAESRLSAPVTYGVPLKLGPGPVPGLTTRRVTLAPLDGETLLFDIPRQEFRRDGERHVMSSQQMVFQGIWRYDLDSKIVAYTIGLTPAVAHRENGKWRVDAEVGCIFWATFIDDDGDGVFRLLALGWMRPDLIPGWAQSPKKDPA